MTPVILNLNADKYYESLIAEMTDHLSSLTKADLTCSVRTDTEHQSLCAVIEGESSFTDSEILPEYDNLKFKREMLAVKREEVLLHIRRYNTIIDRLTRDIDVLKRHGVDTSELNRRAQTCIGNMNAERTHANALTMMIEIIERLE